MECEDARVSCLWLPDCSWCTRAKRQEEMTDAKATRLRSVIATTTSTHLR